MTLLAFGAGGRRYGIDVRAVAAVVPVPPLRPLDLAPEWVAGVFVFLGHLVPVVDLCRIHGGCAARRAFGTRIVVVPYPGPDGTVRHVGLAAEGVTDIVELDGAALQPPGVRVESTPWLGAMGPDERGELLQVVDVDRLLPAEVRDLLFA
jgi:chemotaxis-related protein WspB